MLEIPRAVPATSSGPLALLTSVSVLVPLESGEGQEVDDLGYRLVTVLDQHDRLRSGGDTVAELLGPVAEGPPVAVPQDAPPAAGVSAT